MYNYFNLVEISAYHLQLKCMGGHFFSGPEYKLFTNTPATSAKTKNHKLTTICHYQWLITAITHTIQGGN